MNNPDAAKAAACYTFPIPTREVLVTPGQLRGKLIEGKYTPAEVDLLLKDDYVPQRVRLGDTMLVIRK